jgi:indole-3-glycerol phosphate synthase
MNILDKIVAHKKIEVSQRKALTSTKQLEQSTRFEEPCYSMREFLLHSDKFGIIAEFKRRSPSQGDINTHSKVEEVTTGYVDAGASALSILTDFQFFGGQMQDLMNARNIHQVPILRKDFMVDEYQILEAKSIGADVILLIGECLSKSEVKQLSAFAKSLGLEVLMEVHSEKELLKLSNDIDIVGVNNRDLMTFEVSTQTSVRLFDIIPNDFIKISESGITNPQTILDLKAVGFQGFLIGEAFMKTANPALAAKTFMDKLLR